MEALKARTVRREPTLIRVEADDRSEVVAGSCPELGQPVQPSPALGRMPLLPGAIGEAERVPEPLSPVVAGLTARAQWWRLALSADDRAALGVWAAAHLALFVLAWAAAWVYRATPDHAPLTGVFEHWDAVQYKTIAQYGYFRRTHFPTILHSFPATR